jgi:hypothetical protein
VTSPVITNLYQEPPEIKKKKYFQMILVNGDDGREEGEGV